MNTLDWKKVEQFVEERKPVELSAGILNDWFWTAATVYKDGKWKDKDQAYVTSSWAIPGFKATMENGDVIEVVAMTEETEEQAAERADGAFVRREDADSLAGALLALVKSGDRAAEDLQDALIEAKEELSALREAVKPFAAIIDETSGRIPTERLSLANWHDLVKAFNKRPNVDVTGAAPTGKD